MLKASLDASQVMADYSQALRRLAQLTGMDQRQVLLAEAGAILKTWAGRTKVAKTEDADRRTRIAVIGPRGLELSKASEPGDVSVNMGVRGSFGRVWVRSPYKRHHDAKAGTRPYRLAGVIDAKSLSFRPMNYHWKTGTWVDITEAVADVTSKLRSKIPKGRRATGLARQSVIQIADRLGIDLNAVKGGGISAAGIAKARKALATTGIQYQNGTGNSEGDGIKSTVTLINNLPSGVKQGMDRTLLGIINGRQKFFQQSYAKGAFDTMTRTARAYPWLRVTPPPGAN